MATIRSVRKQCRICGEDCSDRARVKDQFGHYYCQECARAHMAPGAPLDDSSHPHHTQSINHADLHADVIETIRAEEAAASAQSSVVESAVHDGTEGETEALADDGLDDDIIPLAPPDETVDVSLSSCPVCFHRYPPEAGFCANCGYDPQRGIQSSRFIEASRAPRQGHASQPLYACPQCHHDMAHATSLVCPECGHHMPTMDKTMRDQAAAVPREPVRAQTDWQLIGALAVVAGVIVIATLLILNF